MGRLKSERIKINVCGSYTARGTYKGYVYVPAELLSNSDELDEYLNDLSQRDIEFTDFDAPDKDWEDWEIKRVD